VSRTVLQLRQAAARALRDHWGGTLTQVASIGSLTVYDTQRIEADGYLANGYLHLGADATAEDHRIIGNAAGGLTLANDGGIVTLRSAGTAYEIHKLGSVAEYNSFITDAIVAAGAEAALASKDDQTLIVTANASKPGGVENEYVIPAGFKYIWEVWVDDQSGYFDQRIPMDQLMLLPGATKKLRFSEWAAAAMLRTGQRIRLLGQALEAEPALADTSVVTVDAQYIVNSVELSMLIPIASGTGARAQAAIARARNLTQLVELRRTDAAADARILPGSLVVPN